MECALSFGSRKVVKIIFSLFTLSAFFVSGVSSAVSVSVMEGDSVTLNTGVEIAPDEDVKWYFNDIRIAQMNGDLSFNCTDVKCSKDNERFKDRLKLNCQTGSLTITDTTTKDSGEYQLKIIESSSIREKNFNLTVLHADDVDKVKAISVKEGESVTLDSGVIKKTCDVMMWYFNDNLITKDPSLVCLTVQSEDEDERFRDRLKVDNQTGSLTITNTRTTDSGVYHLKISCQTRSRSVGISSLKVFNVTVTGLAPSSVPVRGIRAGVSVMLFLIFTALICACKHRARRKGSRIKFSKMCCLKESSPKLSDTTSTDATNDMSHDGHILHEVEELTL